MIKLCGKSIEEKYYNEKISISIDNPRLKDDELYEYNRNFLKVFGIKGDVVGYACVNNIYTDVLSAMLDRANAEKVKINLNYELNLTPDYESEWYLLKGLPISDASDAFEWNTYNDDKGEYYLGKVRAFAIPPNITITDRGLSDFVLFREDVIIALQKGGFKGFDCIWAYDFGKYKSRQFFHIYPEYCIPECYVEDYTKVKKTITDYSELTENLKIIVDNYKNYRLELPIAVDSKWLNNKDFAYRMYKNKSYCFCDMLVSRKCRNFLIEQGLAHENYFSPILVVDNLDDKIAKPLIRIKNHQFKLIPNSIKAQIQKEYEDHNKKIKPERKISEKMALQILRLAKKDDTDNFGKRASVKKLEQAIDERLIPYYKVADGGWLSDEFNFLCISDAIKENSYFWSLQNAEIENIIPEKSIVFAKCSDGEFVILLPDGKVVRYLQGELDFYYTWPNLPAFFIETIEI